MTKIDYSQLSDFEINKLVAEIERVRGFHCENVGGESALKFPNRKELDYCNNWADAGPIIVENKISFYQEDNEWCACSNLTIHHSGQADWECMCYDTNPLRAAMIVFLEKQ